MIKIDFEFDSEFGIYRDALVLPEDHQLSEDDIELLKKERLDNWIAILNAPPAENVQEDFEYIEIDGVKYIKVEE
jgi:hypothetical protein